MCFRVTGDGHQGISSSGISHSAFGSRLQAPDGLDLRPESFCLSHFCTFARGSAAVAPLHCLLFVPPANHPVSGSPLTRALASRHLPPGAATCHPKRCLCFAACQRASISPRDLVASVGRRLPSPPFASAHHTSAHLAKTKRMTVDGPVYSAARHRPSSGYNPSTLLISPIPPQPRESPRVGMR
jgi:hypothetical protein